MNRDLISNKKFYKRYKEDYENHNSGAWLILMERLRHYEVEGYDYDHDETHKNGELALAGASYAIPENHKVNYDDNGDGGFSECGRDSLWPFDKKEFKETPKDRIRELIKAGSLIAAEIDRLQKTELELEKE